VKNSNRRGGGGSGEDGEEHAKVKSFLLGYKDKWGRRLRKELNNKRGMKKEKGERATMGTLGGLLRPTKLFI